MRIAKWAAIVVGGLLLLLVASIFVLTSVVDPSRYRGKVETVVSDRVGRPFIIEGPLQITWFPWLGVHTGAARLEDPSRPPMLEWQSVFVAAKVLPLLKGQLVVDRIQLEGPRLRLRRDAQGHGNWEDLGAPGGSRSSPAAPRPGPAPEIAGLAVRNGEVDYRDEASGLSFNLSNLSFEVGAWRPGRSLPVHARFLLRGGSLPANGIWMEVDSPALGVVTQPLRVEAPKLGVKVADAEIDGNLTYEQAVAAHGSMTAHVPSVRKLAADLGLNQTMPHDPTTLGRLELTADWTYVNRALAARPLSVKVDDVTFKGWVEHDASPDTGWRFELHGDRIDLGRYVNVDTTSQKPFELEMLKDINANGSLTFDEAVLADTRMSGVQLRFESRVKQ